MNRVLATVFALIGVMLFFFAFCYTLDSIGRRDVAAKSLRGLALTCYGLSGGCLVIALALFR